MKVRHRHFLAFAAPVLILFLVTGAGGLREDELACEEAIAHLQKCCPDFHAGTLSCEYQSGCGSTEYPALATADSECIQKKDCVTLKAEGICDSAQSVTPIVVDANAGSTHARVCR